MKTSPTQRSLTPAELKALFPNATASVLAANAEPLTELFNSVVDRAIISERQLNPAESRREIKELHLPFMRWLDLNELLYISPRSDRSTGIMPGWPDFTIIHNTGGIGRVICVEMKWPGQKLRSNQAEVHERLRKAGVPVITATSVEEAIQFVRAELLTITPAERREEG